MRHAKLSTTIDIYVHNDNYNKRETANMMDQLQTHIRLLQYIRKGLHQ